MTRDTRCAKTPQKTEVWVSMLEKQIENPQNVSTLSDSHSQNSFTDISTTHDTK